MADSLGMAAQLATQSLRFGWYFGIHQVMDWQRGRLGAASPYKPKRPIPSTQELFADLGGLLMRDAMAVRDGIYPPSDDEPGSPLDHWSRVRAMFADLPGALQRRESEDATTARAAPDADGLPDYFTQDFHFQTGGYLTEESARLYDVQVETLFLGTAGPMRRAGLRPIAEFMRGRDQRGVSLLDIACGTGRFLRQVRAAYPAMRLTGLDLSKSYLAEAEKGFENLRPATWLRANGEKIPLPDASQDIVTSVFLFHELPPEARRNVVAEFARVLKPGGLLVFIDSLQMGDKPGWDGLLEAFPVRFHEPYFRHYSIDDLDGMFASAGLEKVSTETAFLSKVMARKKGTVTN
jgi:ubiquinone/menaquinone biosynthesis C-methylase UbiE